MTAETSTYFYDSGTEETVTLSRGPATPHGHALLKITYSDGRKSDCYVNLAWLRDRADHLADTPRPLTPDADAGISYLDQPTLAAITNLGEALDTLSRAWPGHFDIDLAVKSSGEQIAAWHQEGGVTEWYFGHKEQS